MAILYAETFDKYDAVTAFGSRNEEAGSAWVANDGSGFGVLANAGPWGNASVQHGFNTQYAVPWAAKTSDGTLFWSGNVWYDGNTSSAIGSQLEAFLSWERASNLSSGVHFALLLGIGGAIYVADKDGNFVDRIYNSFHPKTWHHIEIKVVSGAGTGSSIIKVDGVTVSTLTSQNYLGNFGSLSGSYIQFRGVDGRMKYSDVIIADSTGSTFHTSPIGQYRLETQLPSADGSLTAWTPNTGAAHNAVDDALASAPSDTDYISDSTLNDISTFVMTTFVLANQTAIAFAKVSALARSDTTGDKVACYCKSGGANAVSGDINLFDTPANDASAYLFRNAFFEVDPNTSAAWTLSNLNAAEFGVKKR